ncbi:HD-GYP domain-containing protein [Rhodopirellula sp. JC639]|uniref:HD-GYP domain-containing protein n=1 Tax=Stieleria mannarensis TaxID=2755585 RepID=UPI001602A689|nr:HD-GYP domain-containing protein [Rhodopirellula sp. JC639]
MSLHPSSSTDPASPITDLAAISAAGNATDASLASEVDQLADALAARFEELTLIHGLTQRLASSLTLTEQSHQVARSLLDELAPCITSAILAIHLFPSAEHEQRATQQSALLSPRHSDEIFEIVGHSVTDSELVAIVEATRAKSKERTGDAGGVALVNDLQLAGGTRLRSVVVPIHRGSTSLGQMVAIRTADQPEFGTIEANMMSSTSTMLAVHLLNQQQYQQMQGMFESMIQSLASALDAKDAYTCGHSNRVAELSFQLASRLGYDDHALANIRMGGILHDIGKIGVDDSVLRKPTRLTDEEFEQIKRHPVLGYDILKGIEQFHPILPAVRHHHESWDGSGYPDGLAGDEIPRDAQIVAVADAFDAMSSDRPYRPGMKLEKVVQIFRQGRGVQWAADVVDTLLSLPNLQQYS